MKIISLQISNVLSFPHCKDISTAEKITIDDGLNIIIGENGSGKSTALEVINFIFKRVIYRQYNVNQDLFGRRLSLSAKDRRQILQPANNSSYSGFRLDPNWDAENEEQQIRLVIRLDEIDLKNIENLRANHPKLIDSISLYTTHNVADDGKQSQEYIFNITLNRNTQEFQVNLEGSTTDFGYQYLSEYNFFKEAISIHNFLNAEEQIEPLLESFTLISSYRNYHAFQPSVTLKDQHPAQQIQNIRVGDYSKSLNTSDQSEPPIFALVRLQVAEKHFDLIEQKYSNEECEGQANKLPFIQSINKRLKVVNLECKIRLFDKRTWQYSFEFFDLRRQRVISDINSLSAGQKAILHLVFEAYGRGDLKGGVVIIDEPEIHLHYQFQHEYLQVIDDLNKDQNCQYVLVTHSEALINSSTINNVRRFALSPEGHTRIYAPTLTTEQKHLIKILDNSRSTYAFFAKKVVLVEGDTDRYFFRSVVLEKHPEVDQEIAILNMGGRDNYEQWNDLFGSFGLSVFCISDFDFIVPRHYPSERGVPLKNATQVSDFKKRNTDWETKINNDYANGIFILKDGDLEHYLGIKKGLPETIDFCKNQLVRYLASSSSKSKEISKILETIVNYASPMRR